MASYVPILLVNSDDEAPIETEVEHSFISGEGTDSNSEVEMPPKIFKLPSGKLALKKHKAFIPALVASRLDSSLCRQKGKGKAIKVGTSRK